MTIIDRSRSSFLSPWPLLSSRELCSQNPSQPHSGTAWCLKCLRALGRGGGHLLQSVGLPLVAMEMCCTHPWLQKMLVHLAFQLSPYFFIDVIHQGQQECVEVPQEEGKDASQLPLQPDTRMVIFECSDGFKQGGAKHAQQGHHNFNLPNKEKATANSNNRDYLTVSCDQN